MPIYEFQCRTIHSVFEKFYQKPEPPNTTKCLVCGGIADIVFSLSVPKPDKYWAGQVVMGQYVTSQKAYDKVAGHIAPATRDTKEWVAKRQIEVHKEKKVKQEKVLHDVVVETVRDVEFGDKIIFE